MRINPHHLEVFQHVARCSSVTRAAEALNISQPAVSAQIRDLERACGMLLVTRHGRGIALTHAGEVVARHAQRIVDTLADLDRALGNLRGVIDGRLTLGGSTTVGEYLLPQYMGAFHRRFPGVELQLVIANSHDISARVLRRDIDLGFTGGAVDQPELRAAPWLDDEIVVIASAQSPLANQSTILPTELAGDVWILRERGSATRAMATIESDRLGIRGESTMELGSNEAIKRAVAAGLGVGFISRHAIRAELIAGEIVVLPVAGWTCRRPLYVVARRDLQPNAAEQAFLAQIGVELPSWTATANE